MMAPANMPATGVVYYNAGMAPNAGGPQVHFVSQPLQQLPSPQLQPPQQLIPSQPQPTQQLTSPQPQTTQQLPSPPAPQESQQQIPNQQFQPLPAIKK